MQKLFLVFGALLILGMGSCQAELEFDQESDLPKVDANLGSEKEGSRTDENVVQREEEAIKIDGLNVAQIKELREKSEKFKFQAEVNRMMKLIINSLYKNKEIFLRELISNASDALDKLRLLALTDKSVLDTLNELSIRIRVDKENQVISVTDTGIGMTKDDLVKNLGTIAKSGTSDFLQKMQDADSQQLSDLIGQFGVGFYSSFLVADRVVVTSKSNDDAQHIWESNAAEFSVVKDPRGDTLKRGTQINLQMKPEASNYLEERAVRELIKKYSQFINFPIYLWTEKTIEEEVPLEEEAPEKDKTEDPTEEDEDAKVEDGQDEKDKPKTKKVSKTVYDWELINDSKPIWTRKPGEVEDSEYAEFYKSITKDSTKPLAHTHFVAEGEVTFKALLFVPEVQPSESFNRYGTRTDNIKLYVRRVFITDDFHEMMPNYLAFVRGVVDSDDLPLNVSRETLQQNKLIKVIRKKLIRKTLDMLKKLEGEDSEKFWKEYSTNIKLGVIEDTANKSRLAKLLRFFTSNSPATTTLTDYVSRMKDKQDSIYYIAGSSREEVEKSPFVERLLKKGFEVLYLTEAVDEYCVGALPEFEGKKFQNVAKEGLSLADGKAKEKLEETKTVFEPLTKWLSETALKDQILKAELSERLDTSPCALVTSRFGWTGNMERLITSQTHSKANDVSREYYLNQKKTLEVNPRHPIIKELLRRVKDDASDPNAKEMALMMFRTATLRSGYMLKDTAEFAETVEKMMRQSLGVPVDEEIDEDEVEEEETQAAEEDVEAEETGDSVDTERDEL